jgi:hypothetical protein
VIKKIRGVIGWLCDSAILALPPMLINVLFGWPDSFSVAMFGGFVAAYFGLMLLWWIVLAATGFLRWRLYRVWRPGMRPCMCDKPAYCLRHHSSTKEPNRPGVVAARLAESEDA